MSNMSSTVHLSVFERMVFGLVGSVPWLLCLWVNILMLWTLRSKAVFRETARFGLLFQLLLSDTLQMVVSHVLFLLAYLRVLLSFPLCLLLVLLVHTAHNFSPLVLVLMSLERWVAVCLPLRHSVIATARNTAATYLGAWAVNAVHSMARIGIVLQTTSINTQVEIICNSLVLYPSPDSRLFAEVLTYSLLLAAFLSISVSYAAVIRAARSASTDQVLILSYVSDAYPPLVEIGVSAGKARTTLLLHLLQLCFMITSTFHDVLMMALFFVVPPVVFARIQAVFYILLIILPKCLSVLVYGLRDPTIRAALLLHLCCKTHK